MCRARSSGEGEGRGCHRRQRPQFFLIVSSRHIEMDALSHLPLELVLAVAEHAAWSEPHNRKGWLASLCCVNRTFRALVTPILYHTLEITRRNGAALARLAELQDSHVALTRCVIFAAPTVETVDDATRDAVLRGMRNLRDYTGTSEWVGTIVAHHPDLHLSSVFLTDAIRGSPSFLTALGAVPRLHFVVPVDNHLFLHGHDLDRVTTSHVIIDAFQMGATESATLAGFVQSLAPLLRLPKLERLLLRPRLEDEHAARLFCQLLTAWVARVRDGRVWLDDVHVDSVDSNGELIYHVLDTADALRGHDLWLSGSRGYSPERNEG